MMKLPTRTVTYILICAGGILAFILLVIYPYQKTLNDMDMEIRKIRAQTEGQKIFFPVFKELLKRTRIKNPEGLPFPQKEKLSQDDTDRIVPIFQEIAKKSNLKIESIKPNVESLIEGSGYLTMDVVMKGDFFDFRKFFLELESLPYLEHIERLQIRLVEGMREISMRIWMVQG